MSAENERLFDMGILKARAIIMSTLSAKMREFSEVMLKDAYELRTPSWKSWSGNTETSYTCGFAVNGQVVQVKSLGESIPAPLIPKLKKGETKRLKLDYSGRKNQRRTGNVNVTDPYGMQTAQKTVKEISGKLARGVMFRMATGTEYSKWLEMSKGWKVLQGSFSVAEARLKSVMGI